MGKAIGIDLGTTNSCAAIVEGGKPRVITYKGGQSTIPSVFAIDEKGDRLVGHDAKNFRKSRVVLKKYHITIHQSNIDAWLQKSSMIIIQASSSKLTHGSVSAKTNSPSWSLIRYLKIPRQKNHFLFIQFHFFACLNFAIALAKMKEHSFLF